MTSQNTTDSYTLNYPQSIPTINTTYADLYKQPIQPTKPAKPT